MWLDFITLLFVFNTISAQFSYRNPSTCVYPRLEHGRVRMRQKAKLVKFTCFIHYELVGNKYATCRDGHWDVPLPVCVRPGCSIPKVDNGVQMPMRQGAWVVFFCLPGFRLVGSSAIYCDGRRWNDTTPSCVDESSPVKLSCDFEDPSLCGWTQDELHDFDWKRLNKETPSSFLFTGPSYDHTFGKGGAGYYMYIESTSKMENDTARLISPIYDATLAKNGCFSFFYHMYGKSIGGLRVYQKPENYPLQMLLRLPQGSKQRYVLFEKWGNLGDFWFSAAPKLVDFSDNFQIVIEGIRGPSFTSDIAIDDVAILQGNDCIIANEMATTPVAVLVESCNGKCDSSGDIPSGLSCGCSSSCVANNNCCPDFFEICAFPDSTTLTYEDDIPMTSENFEPAPQTQKLVATTIEDRPLSTEPTATSSTTKTTTTSTTTTKSPTTTSSTTPIVVMNNTKTNKITTTKTTSIPKLVFKSSTPTYNATGKLQKDNKSRINPIRIKKINSSIAVTPASKTLIPRIVTTKVSTISAVTRKTGHDAFYGMMQKAQKEKSIEDRRIVQDESKSGSNAFKTIAIIVLVAVFCTIVVRAAILTRGAGAQVTLARLRGHVQQDPSVRYLTSYTDEE